MKPRRYHYLYEVGENIREVIVPRCHCHGILNYLYAYFWQCRDCGRWLAL